MRKGHAVFLSASSGTGKSVISLQLAAPKRGKRLPWSKNVLKEAPSIPARLLRQGNWHRPEEDKLMFWFDVPVGQGPNVDLTAPVEHEPKGDVAYIPGGARDDEKLSHPDAFPSECPYGTAGEE